VAAPVIIFDHVWKKFRKGERHDSLRDLIPSLAGRVWRRPPASELKSQEFWAIRDVSFSVEPGQALGIIGPNGAGKSTVLKLLTRVLRPTSGKCVVVGRTGALIEIAAGFHPDLTGRENIYLQGAIMGLRQREIDAKLEEIVAFASIGDFIDTPVKRYSSGMNARLGFAVAAALEPDVLLIDEVLAVGDLSFQQKCYERLSQYRKRGTAVAFVSHSMQAIALVCDRALLLRPGAEPELGSVAEIVPHYMAAASAIGSNDASVLSSQISDPDGKASGASFPPSRSIMVSCRVRAAHDLPRCGWGVNVIRSDGLIVFDCGSTLEGQSPTTIHAGQVLDLRVALRLNLGKGLYTIVASLYDEQRAWPTIELGTVGTFMVETGHRNSDAVAFLEPVFEPIELT
jgi:lipopolysaccharide transport system ATP-binding protein